MNRFYPYLIGFLLVAGFGTLLLSCGNWDLPARKSQRVCIKPSGNLDARIQQRNVSFSITNSSGTIDKVVWDFGNGSTSATTGMTISYPYPAPGTYTVKATLTNTCGLETTLQRTVLVSDAVLPTVTLQPAADVSNTSAMLRMTITANGNATITRYGVVYSSMKGIPDITDGSMTVEKTDPVAINTTIPFSLTGLLPNTLYYVRSFAVNSAGAGYSTPVQTFQTGQDAVIALDSVTVGIATANISFKVTTLGNPPITAYGVYYSSNIAVPDQTNAPSVTVSNPALGRNFVEIRNLAPDTKYYYRPYSKSATGEITYGNAGSFTTLPDPVTQGLIASVSFSDRSLLDVSGNNNHVKLVGNPLFTTDRKGRANAAILLNGTGDYFYMPENSSLNPEELSISIWIKPGSFSGRTQEENKRMQIYNKSRFSDGAFERYSSQIKLENDVGPGITFITDIKQGSMGCQSGKGWQDLLFTSNVNLNDWHHLVFTYSGRSGRMYFDNALLYTTDALPADKIDNCVGGDLKFGAQSQALPWYFKGAMDDIRIYKRALSKGEVDALFRQ